MLSKERDGESEMGRSVLNFHSALAPTVSAGRHAARAGFESRQRTTSQTSSGDRQSARAACRQAADTWHRGTATAARQVFANQLVPIVRQCDPPNDLAPSKKLHCLRILVQWVRDGDQRAYDALRGQRTECFEFTPPHFWIAPAGLACANPNH